MSDGIEITEQHGAWTVRMRWSTEHATGGPQRIVIEPSQEAPSRAVARGISTTVLRSINPTAPRPAVQKTTVQDRGAGSVLAAALRQQLAEGVSPAYLAALSTVYAQLSAAGVRPLVPHLAEIVGRSAETVSGHLKQARKQGYLTAAATGKPGGEPTKKSTDLLAKLGLTPDQP